MAEAAVYVVMIGGFWAWVAREKFRSRSGYYDKEFE